MPLIKGKSAIFVLLMIFGASRVKWIKVLENHAFQLGHPLLHQKPLAFSTATGLRLFAQGRCIKKDGSTAKHGKCGEDSYMISLKADGPSVISVADGVGGWASHGGDSSGVSNGMMKLMKRLHQDDVKTEGLNHLLSLAFDGLKAAKKFSKGTTTICAALFDPASGKLNISNLGDSQMVVIREGKVILEVEPGTWAFNSPFQIGFGLYGEPQGEVDEMTINKELFLKRGDIIVMGTDGLFDNLYVTDIESTMREQHFEHLDPSNENSVSSSLSKAANQLALKAYSLGMDDNYLSPFSKEAIAAGKAPSNYLGGKPDDISIICALVA